MHTDFVTAKEKQKQKTKTKNSKQTLHIYDVPFALHFRRGAQQHLRPSPRKPRARTLQIGHGGGRALRLRRPAASTSVCTAAASALALERGRAKTPGKIFLM